MPSISVNGQPVSFPAPLAGSCFKSSSDRSHSSCRDISKQGPQSSLVRELVTGDPMACSIVGWPHNCPSGIIACHQIWQLSPRLEHGCVESIDQLAWYHTQIDTPVLSGVTSSAPVRPDSIDMWFILSSSPYGSASQRSSRAQWSTCRFLFASFSTSYAGIPSATHLTTLWRASPHRFFNFRH